MNKIKYILHKLYRLKSKKLKNYNINYLNYEYIKILKQTILYDADIYKNLENLDDLIILIKNLKYYERKAFFDVYKPKIINYDKIVNYKFDSNVICIKNVKSLSNDLFYNYVNLNKIEISNDSDLSFIHSNNFLIKNIDFDYYFDKNIDFLNGFKKLENINFNYNFNNSIKALEDLYSLKYISLCGYFNQTIESLSNLHNLIELKILSYDFNQSLKPIENLNNLKVFRLYSNKFNQNVNYLNNLKNLKDLSILSDDFQYPIDYLKDLTMLQKFELGFNYNNNIDVILNFTNLTELKINLFCDYLKNEERKYSLILIEKNIGNFKNLEELKLNKIYNLEFTEINKLKNLKRYDLFNLNSKKFEPNYNIKNLTLENYFNISNIELIGLMQNIVDLNLVDIDYSSSSNFNYLHNLVNLKNLCIGTHRIYSLYFLRKLKKLKFLYLNIDLLDDPISFINIGEINNLNCLLLYGNYNYNILSLKKLTKLKYLFLQNDKYEFLNNVLVYLVSLHILSIDNLNTNIEIDEGKYIFYVDNEFVFPKSNKIKYNKLIEKYLLINYCKKHERNKIKNLIDDIINKKYL